MSLILEALKRSEAQRGEGNDALLVGKEVGGYSTTHRARVGLWALAVVLGSIAVVVAILFRPHPRRPPATNAPAARPRIVPPVPPASDVQRVMIPRPSVVERSLPARPGTMPVNATPPAPAARASVPVPAPSKPATVEALTPKSAGPSPVAPLLPRAAEPPKDSVTPAKLPPPVAPTENGSTRPKDDPVSREALNRLLELLDKVDVSAHVYSEERAQRFVFVNGRIYREGERVNPEGFRIDEITADGLVVEKDGVRARVPVAR